VRADKRGRAGICEVMQQKKEVRILLADSFKELVLKKPIEKITIKEITDGAGVIRVTFYNHFQDKYELLEWIFREEVIGPLRILLWNDMVEEALTFMFNAILKNKEFYSRASRLEGQNSFSSIMNTCFAELISEYLEDHIGQGARKYEWLTPARLGDFGAQNMTYFLMNWIHGGMQQPPEEMVEIYNFVTSHALKDLTREL